MESLEIHSKDYLVRWVIAKSDHTISWTVHPHKRSVNIGLFKHPGHLGGLAQFAAVGGLPNLNRPEQSEDEDEGTHPAVVEKLKSIGLKQILKLSRYDSDKYTQGSYAIPPGEAGNYALVFDNTFSKSVSKTVTMFLLTYPTICQGQIHFGAQLHHSQAMATAMASTPSLGSRKSPRLGVQKTESDTSLRTTLATHAIPSPTLAEPMSVIENSDSIHTGILQKRRRKRGQGYARRFFCLDYTSTTLSYYHDKNSSALRGAIPLALAAIGANARTREISIDSGAEIWHLKASNKADFEQWKAALEKASRQLNEASAEQDLGLDTNLASSIGASGIDDQDWARLEEILSRIAGTRDSIRRLCLETKSSTTSVLSPGSGLDSQASTPTGDAEDYFKQHESRRAFWKRKPSSPAAQSSNPSKRSVSAQSAAHTMDALNGGTPYLTPTSAKSHQHEQGMHGHMKALLADLDGVVSDFSGAVVDFKQRRTVPKSALSRLSMHSAESQEFFDAEPATASQLFNIPDESDDSGPDGDGKSVTDSVSSSDMEDGAFSGGGREFRSGSLSSLLPPKPKSLTPLPHDTVTRRNSVPAPTLMPPSLIGFLRKNVGKDLSSISMPVSANEPLSLLQRAAEALEYSDLLESATKSTDAGERMVLVTAFVISQLSNFRVKERSLRKPFNPMLGETYELVREDLNFRFLAEKVSHRPVQLACYAEGTNWSYAQSPLPSQKFWGKSSEIVTEGKARLVLYSSSECFSWNSPQCFLRNIIAGEKYVEPVGNMTILNETSGAKSVVTFKSKSMFSGRSEEVDVQVFDHDGSELPLGLAGTWTSSLQTKQHGKPSSAKPIWAAGPLVPKAEKHYGMTAFAASLNEITDMEKGKVPSTDSRLRPDQRTLESGDYDTAEQEKVQLEEAQRARRREMEASEQAWEPRWFTRIDNGDEIVWKLKTGPGSYWDQRAKGEWTDVVDVLRI